MNNILNDLLIIIPSYNSTEKDILKTFSGINDDYHVLVIDDGSDIPFEKVSGMIINKFKNLVIQRFVPNKGIELSLKSAVEIANELGYKYVARLDIGDYCSKDRFIKQYDFLEKNEDYVIVGSNVNYVDIDGNLISGFRSTLDDVNIRKKMCINNAFVHSSVMLRLKSVNEAGNYRDKYIACEDYDLFYRMLNLGKAYNLEEYLVYYTLSQNGISAEKKNKQITNRMRIIIENIRFKKNFTRSCLGIFRCFIELLIPRSLLKKFISIIK